jgi:hypothetical protein
MWPIITWLVDMAIATAIYAGIAYGLYYLFAPGQPKPKPPGKYHYDLPTAEEGRPFPILFGKCRIRGLNAISPIFNKSRTVIESEKYGNAILYYAGVHLGVCGPNIDGIKQIWFGETIVWPNDKKPSVEAEDNLTFCSIDAENCWWLGLRLRRRG